MNKPLPSLNGHFNGEILPGKAVAEDIFEDHHLGSALDTPLRPDAFDLSDQEKMEEITKHFRSIMDILGLDLEDDSLSGTPRRVAKMFVKEIFGGLHPERKPDISLFENKFGYKNMLVERDITVKSFCEHHFLPIIGRAHVAYIPDKHVIGLSKINRIVDYYARRPQVQERLNRQIAQELRDILGTDDVAVIVDARHMCVEARGVQHDHSSTITSEFSGKFLNENVKQELLQQIKMG